MAQKKAKKANPTKSPISIRGARVHNLKDVNVDIPRNQMVVITGLSGSGKSSLAFDTLYAEGQRRYVESLSSYARQFLGRINKPDVDNIVGISPAVAIEQKVNTRNPRSTVGTTTEIYDYIKLLYARVGKTISPESNQEVKRHTVTDVVDFIQEQKEGTKCMLLSPFESDKEIDIQLGLLLQQGFSRIQVDGEILRINEFLEEKKKKNIQNFNLLIDRFVVKKDDEDNESRIADSVQTSFYEGSGICYVEVISESGKNKITQFSNKFELDGMEFEEPSVHFFSFNNPLGACKSCEGFGSIIGIDEDLVIPDKSLSVYEDAIVCWRGDTMKRWKERLLTQAHNFDFPVHRPYFELSAKDKELLWTGNEYFKGLNAFFKHIEEKSYKIQYRVMLSRYRGRTKCPECNGTRLRKDANYVKVMDRSISELVVLSVADLLEFFKQIELNEHDRTISRRLLIEIENRLQYLVDVGLGYLTLNRLSNSLSGGESQRINLATSLGSSLVGSMYILDEPSIGLHPRDTQRLIKVLSSLKKIGNSVIIVEHDEEIMRAADQLIDMGPMAGSHGGELVFQGNHDALVKEEKSLTARYLTGKETIELPTQRRSWNKHIEVKGARENNLKNIDVKFPLHCLTVVTGVSGSGKTSLVKTVLYPAIKKIQGTLAERSGDYDRLDGDYQDLTSIELVDQNPIGKSSRSNPVTYIKAYDEIRSLFAEQQEAQLRGYKPAHFSFNVAGGRCDVCEGEGEVKIEMQFMADIRLECDECKGKRFKSDVLEIQYQEKSISDILEMTVDDAIEFFSSVKNKDKKKESTLNEKIINKLQVLSDVGLGYVHLGQSSSTLSGGEAQRIKLASFLIKGNTNDNILFIFDEPTTGLHFHDIKKLLYAFNALIEQGHSLIIIEHNSEVIKSADWVIDLGPEGGEAGGNIVFEGLPEDLIKSKESYTGKFLREKF